MIDNRDSIRKYIVWLNYKNTWSGNYPYHEDKENKKKKDIHPIKIHFLSGFVFLFLF